MKLKNNDVLELGKSYRFAGYDWTACELINNGKTAVIQSHGVTHGKWPGYKMEKFGNGNYYGSDIDGEDISSYDDKMQKLYEAIRDVEDVSATYYGKGLYISRERAGFTEWSKPGSGYYWQALKAAAKNFSLFEAPNHSAWLGAVYGSTSAWYVSLNGNVYSDSQYFDLVIAPSFNLDLSKVEVVENQIIKK